MIKNYVITRRINYCSSLDFSISCINRLIKLICIYKSPSLNKIEFINNL